MLPSIAVRCYRYLSLSPDTKAPVSWTGGDGFRRETIAQTGSVTLWIGEIRMRSLLFTVD
jgi:hypothetical protein